MSDLARVTLFLMVGLVAAGCNQTSRDDSQPNDPDRVSDEREEAIAATNEAARSVRDYAFAQKDEFIDSANRELAELREEMDRLRDEIAQSSGEARAEARAEAEAKLHVVSERWAAARAQLDQAEAATEAGWDDVQDNYRTARRDLRTSVDDARQWLSERIEP